MGGFTSSKVHQAPCIWMSMLTLKPVSGQKAVPPDSVVKTCSLAYKVTVLGVGGVSCCCRCIMLLHYYPRNALLRGCSAVTPEQGGHSVCMYEGAQIIVWQSSEANKVPIRWVCHVRVSTCRHVNVLCMLSCRAGSVRVCHGCGEPL